jgi:hypothetical protein
VKFTKDSLLATKVGNANRQVIEQALAPKAGAAPPVDGLQNPERKPLPVPALDPHSEAHGRSKAKLALVIAIISFRRREVDEDNLVAGCKPIRDAIAESLCADDRDRRIKWQYRQVIGTGTEGTLVKIDQV